MAASSKRQNTRSSSTSRKASGSSKVSSVPGPKQAVVVVHGMGEQRPLDTLREFVEAVYQRDHSLTEALGLRANQEGFGELNFQWIRPDDSTTGSKELRVIVADSIGADFYEFYWADIMVGTPLERVTAWLKGLLFRSPYRVPRATRIVLAWLILWLLTGVIIASGYMIASPPDWLTAGVETMVGWLREVRWVLGPLLAGGGLVLLGVRLATTKPVARTRFLLPTLLAAGGLTLWWLADLVVFGTVQFWTGLVTAGFAWFTTHLVAPYFGDVVRYVRATPQTVGDRERVRARGLELLRALHDKKRPGPRKRNADSKMEATELPYYDRIVLVAHSLGTVIAYDLLMHFWEERGPTHKHPTSDAVAIAALETVDRDYVQKVWHPNTNPGLGGSAPVNIAAFQEAQADVFSALVTADQGWLISDFVTMGAPLVHAEFLMADSREHLERSFEERLFASSPPRPDLPHDSMLYYTMMGGPYVHFAAPFAAVRWTNICDESWFPAFGDVISGRLRDVYGPGIEEYDIKMRRRGLFSRIFTHTLYWRNSKADWSATDDHITALRKAVDLGRKRAPWGSPPANDPPDALK